MFELERYLSNEVAGLLPIKSKLTYLFFERHLNFFGGFDSCRPYINAESQTYQLMRSQQISFLDLISKLLRI